MKYVLENEIERKQCKECAGIWFHFNHEGKDAYYRLSPVSPDMCTVCYPLDKDLESKSLLSMERWIKVGVPPR